MRNNLKHDAGFLSLEIIAALVLLGIVTTFTVPKISSWWNERYFYEEERSQLFAISAGVKLYYKKYGSFPSSMNDLLTDKRVKSSVSAYGKPYIFTQLDAETLQVTTETPKKMNFSGIPEVQTRADTTIELRIIIFDDSPLQTNNLLRTLRN